MNGERIAAGLKARGVAAGTWSDLPLLRNANGKLIKRALREQPLAAGGSSGG